MSTLPPPPTWEMLAPHYAALEAAPLTPEGVAPWLASWSELEKQLWEGRAHLKRARYRDATDHAAERAYLDYMRTVLGPATLAGQALKEKLLALQGFEPLPDQREMLRLLRNETELFTEANQEVESELAALEGEYSQIVGAMRVTVDGESLTLPEAERRLLDPDREQRERTWHAIQATWQAAREPLNELLIRLVHGRQRLARNAGLDDYRAYRWRQFGRLDYRPADCEALHAAIEAEWVPLATAQCERRRESLRLETVRPWDLATDPSGLPPLAPVADVAQLEASAERILTQLDPDLGAIFQQLRQGWLDLESRPGKTPGGEEWFCPVSGVAYIHMNAVGTHRDLLTLLHESGHASHDMLSWRHQPLFWNLGSPSEFSEFAAMAIELLATPFLARDAGGVYSQDDAQRAIRQQFEEMLPYVLSIVVLDAFQHWLYTQPPETLTPAALDGAWASLWQRFFPNEDWRGLEAHQAAGWQQRPHIFRAPFYAIEYVLAQVAALQLWEAAQQDRSTALTRYRHALSLGQTRPLPQLFEAAGTRLPFDRATVAATARLVARVLA